MRYLAHSKEGAPEGQLVMLCRTPQGVRGLKCLFGKPTQGGGCRTPQGVRGLKSMSR